MRKRYFAKILIFAVLISASFNLSAQSSRKNLSQDEKAAFLNPAHSKKKNILSKPAVLKYLNRTQSSSCDTAVSTMTFGNGLDGVIFNVIAEKDFDITGISANLNGSANYVLYYKTGTYIGYNNNSAAWTSLGSASVIANAAGTATVIPISFSIPVVAGDTIAFYLSQDINFGAGGLKYTNSTGSAVEGSIYNDNGDLQITHGAGIVYPFGSLYGPRIPNVIINYCFPTGLNENTTSKISVSPNVFHNSTTLYINNQLPAKLEIFNVVGATVKKVENIISSTYTIDRDGLNNGVYFYRISQNDKVINTGKLIIQ